MCTSGTSTPHSQHTLHTLHTPTLLGTFNPSQVAPTALRRPSRAAVVAPLCAKKKGFSSEPQAAGLKVNSRGKISSRPGPPPRKQQQAQQLALQQQQEQQQEAEPQAAAAPPSAAPPAAASSSGAAPPARQAAAPPAPAAAAAGPSTVSTPQPVIDRMAKRVAAFAVVPVAGGVLALGAFWYLKVRRAGVFPLWGLCACAHARRGAEASPAPGPRPPLGRGRS